MIDYMVMEAVMLKVQKEDRTDAEKKERQNWIQQEKERLKRLAT